MLFFVGYYKTLMSSDHPNLTISEIGLDPPDLGTNPWVILIFQVYFSVVTDEDDAVYREILKRGMVAPELYFLKIAGKFGLLTQMIV